MRELTTKILDLVISGINTGDDRLNKAVKIASILQSIRVCWGKEDDYLYGGQPLDQLDEMKGVLDGRIFPSEELIGILLNTYDQCVEHAIPQTPEVEEYYRYFTTEGVSKYDNKMVDKIHRIKSTDPTKQEKRITLSERQRIANILHEHGIVDKSTFRRLVG